MHSVRTAAAATLSLRVARLFGMPEAYWAAIATLVMMQSTLGATLTTSVERIVASALGASLGAVESTYFGSNLIVLLSPYFFSESSHSCCVWKRLAIGSPDNESDFVMEHPASSISA